MNKSQAKQPAQSKQCESSYAFEVFQRFVDRHLMEGEHDVRMFLDPSGNYFAMFCTVCDPQMIDLGETRH
jgi:hypothetical protein